MPISKPGDPGGQVGHWVDKCRIFAEKTKSHYVLPLRAAGFSASDLEQFESGILDFCEDRHLNDATFCTVLDILGALLSWFDANENIADPDHRDVVSFMFECLMDGQISVAATQHTQSPVFAVSAC